MQTIAHISHVHLDEFGHRHTAEIVVMASLVYVYVKCLVKRSVFELPGTLKHTTTNWVG